MKIGILSDSHDQLDNFSKAFEYLDKQKIDVSIFCGDFCSPIPVKKCLANYKGTVHAVYGNTEDRHSITNLSHTDVKNLVVHGEFAELKFENRKIAVTHYPLYAKGLASTGDYDAVFYGHQHEMQIDTYGKTLCASPGEIAGFFEDPMFGVYDTETNEIEIIKLNDL